MLTLLFLSYFTTTVTINNPSKKKLSKAENSIFITTKTGRCHGGGRQKKWPDLERYIVDQVKMSWEMGTPLTKEQLHYRVLQHITTSADTTAIATFVKGKPNTLHKYISRALEGNNWSSRKITISQSVPVDWRSKALENTARIRQKFKDENVDVVVNADETFLLFHPFGDKVIAPIGKKRVGTAAQVDNEKFGATVMIACEYKTSSILPPMIIFSGVYCAKLMNEWASYTKGSVALL